MNLYPQDLGAKRHLALLYRRVRRPMPAPESASPHIGWWGRRWVGHKQLTAAPPEVTATSLKAIRVPASVSFVLACLLPLPMVVSLFEMFLSYGHRNPPLAVADLALYSGWFCLSGFACPRLFFRRKQRRLNNTPLSSGEIAALLPQAQDELERAYPTLCMDVTRQDIVPRAEDDLRAALRALGDAIDKLPATRVVGDSPDILTEVLRRTAAETVLSAQTEADRVVAASLLRRAEALHRRADAAHRAGLLVRRFAVLRQEMAAETEALRAGLAAYYTGAHDIADLTRLAEDVRRVAAEAAAVTAAVEEVDASLAPRPASSPVVPGLSEAPLRLGPG